MSGDVSASRERVWAALTEPAQVARWRPGVEAEIDAPAAHPAPGETARWRCRLHDLPVVLEETPRRVVPSERLESSLRLGLFRFEETFTLVRADALGEHTRVGLKITTPSHMPVVGGSLDRFAVRRFATDLAAVTLQAVRDWCERGEPAPALPAPPKAVAAEG